VGGKGEMGESECECVPLDSRRLKKKRLGDSMELGDCAELGPWLEFGRGCRNPAVCRGLGEGEVGVLPDLLW
jgi:hypothetical protein